MEIYMKKTILTLGFLVLSVTAQANDSGPWTPMIQKALPAGTKLSFKEDVTLPYWEPYVYEFDGSARSFFGKEFRNTQESDRCKVYINYLGRENVYIKAGTEITLTEAHQSKASSNVADITFTTKNLKGLFRCHFYNHKVNNPEATPARVERALGNILDGVPDFREAIRLYGTQVE
jgi:hypothetical protein